MFTVDWTKEDPRPGVVTNSHNFVFLVNVQNGMTSIFRNERKSHCLPHMRLTCSGLFVFFCVSREWHRHTAKNVCWEVDAEYRDSFRVLTATIRDGDTQRVERGFYLILAIRQGQMDLVTLFNCL